MTMVEPAQLCFHAATEAFHAGKDTPRDYLERCLDTIGEREPTVRAWVVLNEEGAREQADRSTARWRDGTPRSPIDGLPIGIKDLLETKDMPTQLGCAAAAGNFPRRDNAAVAALREAGAVILGKTVTAELGGSHPGPTTNPFDPRRTPGGSSSGSAAAVAAGMVPAAIGTQVGGSIIRPASYCGNWALKPSQGAINRGERQTTSLCTHGIHASCAEDMWLVAMAIATRAGGDPGHAPLSGPDTPPASHRPFRLGVMETEGWDTLDGPSRGAFEEIVSRVAALGVPVTRRSDHDGLERFERSLVGVRDIATTMTAWENHWWTRDLVAQHPEGVSTRGKAALEVAEKLGVAGYRELLRRRDSIRRDHGALATEVDVLISLSSPGRAPVWSGDAPGEPLARWPTGDAVFNTPSSLLGAPVVTVPLLTVGGMPVGIQVMGHPGTDSRVAAIARWLAQAVSPVAR